MNLQIVLLLHENYIDIFISNDLVTAILLPISLVDFYMSAQIYNNLLYDDKYY